MSSLPRPAGVKKTGPVIVDITQRTIIVCLLYLHLRRPYNLYCVGADVKPCSINVPPPWILSNGLQWRRRRMTDWAGCFREQPGQNVDVGHQFMRTLDNSTQLYTRIPTRALIASLTQWTPCRADPSIALLYQCQQQQQPFQPPPPHTHTHTRPLCGLYVSSVDLTQTIAAMCDVIVLCLRGRSSENRRSKNTPGGRSQNHLFIPVARWCKSSVCVVTHATRSAATCRPMHVAAQPRGGVKYWPSPSVRPSITCHNRATQQMCRSQINIFPFSAVSILL